MFQERPHRPIHRLDHQRWIDFLEEVREKEKVVTDQGVWTFDHWADYNWGNEYEDIWLLNGEEVYVEGFDEAYGGYAIDHKYPIGFGRTDTYSLVYLSHGMSDAEFDHSERYWLRRGVDGLVYSELDPRVVQAARLAAQHRRFRRVG